MFIKLQVFLLIFVTILQLDGATTDRPLDGGIVIQDPNSKEAKEFGHQVVDVFNKEQHDRKIFELYKIHNFTSQVVAGVRYELRLTVLQENCKDDPSCPPKELAASILSQPWIHKLPIIKVTVIS